MFSGEIPFFEITNDMRVVLSVMQGMRPSQPSHDLSKTRGLSNPIWQIVTTCWAHDPTTRPTAENIVEQLRALPNHPVDERQVDNLGINLPSQMLYNHAEHPFSSLPTAGQTAFVPSLGTSGSQLQTPSFNEGEQENPNESLTLHLGFAVSESGKSDSAEDENDSTHSLNATIRLDNNDESPSGGGMSRDKAWVSVLPAVW